MTDAPTPDDMTRRLTELERELAEVRADRDKYRELAYSMADEFCPADPNWTPPPPEDTVDAWELLRELEQKFPRRSP